MTTAQRAREIILEYQRTHNIPDYVMCDIFAWDEIKWDKYRGGAVHKLTIYEQIMFMEFARTPLP